MFTHLLVTLIGFALLWTVQHFMQGRAKIVASIIVIALTLGGLIMDAPKDCSQSASTAVTP